MNLKRRMAIIESEGFLVCTFFAYSLQKDIGFLECMVMEPHDEPGSDISRSSNCDLTDYNPSMSICIYLFALYLLSTELMSPNNIEDHFSGLRSTCSFS